MEKCLSCDCYIEYSSPSKFYCISCRKRVLREHIQKEFLYRKPIEELGLERSIRNILVNNGIEYIDQLTFMTYFDLIKLRSLSQAKARIIKNKLAEAGFRLSTEDL